MIDGIWQFVIGWCAGLSTGWMIGRELTKRHRRRERERASRGCGL